MKLEGKGLEGSPEEIRDLFRDNGLKLSDYLVAPKPSLPSWHFYTSSALIFAVTVALTLGLIDFPQWGFLVFLGGCAATIWLTSSVQIKFDNAWASAFVLIGLFVVLLMAYGQITPTEALQEVKSIKE